MITRSKFTRLNRLRYRSYALCVRPQKRSDHKFYVEYSKDLKLRFEHHQKGIAESTEYRRPLKLICLSQEDAK